jgi:hypothetical protein
MAGHGTTGPAVYVADWREGILAIVDAANSSAPTASLPVSPRLYGVTAAKDRVYFAEPLAPDLGTQAGLTSRLHILSTGQPLTPTLIATLTLRGAAHHAVAAPAKYPAPSAAPLNGTGTLTDSARDLLYLAGGTEGLHLIDVTTPTAPALLATLPVTGPGALATAVGILDHPTGRRLALVAAGAGGLQIADVTDPGAPQHLAAFLTPGGAIGVTSSVTDAIPGGQALAYVAGGLGGVHVIDVTTPTAPQLLGTYATSSSANALVRSGDMLYVAAGWQGILALDVQDPRGLRLLGSYTIPGYAHTLDLVPDLTPAVRGDPTGGSGASVVGTSPAAARTDDVLAIAAGPAGLQLLRVTVAAGPTHILLIPLAGRSITP